jgi:hypothetical protein
MLERPSVYILKSRRPTDFGGRFPQLSLLWIPGSDEELTIAIDLARRSERLPLAANLYR